MAIKIEINKDLRVRDHRNSKDRRKREIDFLPQINTRRQKNLNWHFKKRNAGICAAAHFLLMESNFTKGTASKLKALGIYQIAGGIIGLLLTLGIIAGLTAFSGLLFLILVLAIGLYSYSIYCGILVLKNKVSGLRHSVINQALQLINFVVAGFAFQYISGIFSTIGCDLTDSFSFIFNIGISSWKISINGDTEPFIINFNFVALFLILFIENLKKKINQENLENQIASIGK